MNETNPPPNLWLLFKSELQSVTVDAVLYKDGLDKSLSPGSLSCCPHPPTHSPQLVSTPSPGHDNPQEVIIHCISYEGGPEKRARC